MAQTCPRYRRRKRRSHCRDMADTRLNRILPAFRTPRDIDIRWSSAGVSDYRSATLPELRHAQTESGLTGWRRAILRRHLLKFPCFLISVLDELPPCHLCLPMPISNRGLHDSRATRHVGLIASAPRRVEKAIADVGQGSDRPNANRHSSRPGRAVLVTRRFVSPGRFCQEK